MATKFGQRNKAKIKAVTPTPPVQVKKTSFKKIAVKKNETVNLEKKKPIKKIVPKSDIKNIDDDFLEIAKRKAEKNASLEEELESSRQQNVSKVEFNNRTDKVSKILEDEKKIIWVHPDDIEYHPANSSIYGQNVSEGLKQSIVEYGVVEDIVTCKGVDKPYRALSGNSRKKIMSDPDVISEIKKRFPERSLLVPIKYLGEIDEDEQERLLLEFNVYRNKTYLQRMHEALKEEELVKREAEKRMLSGVGGHEKTGRTDEFLAKKYFGKSKTWFNTAKAVFSSLSIKHDSDYQKMSEDIIVKKLDNDEIKIEAANRSLKSHEPPREEARLDKDITDYDYAEFVKRIETEGIEIEDCNNVMECAMAYKYHSSIARAWKNRQKYLLKK